MNKNYICIKTLFFILFCSSCVSIRQHRQVQDELLNVKARLLRLEQGLNTTTPTLDTKIASLEADFEKIKIELQKIKGEIDTIRVGVKTGQLPDAKEDEPSVAKTLDALIKRVEELENATKEMLQTQTKQTKDLQENEEEPKYSVSDNDSDLQINSLSELREAFNSKKYNAVIKNIPVLIKKYKTKKSQEEISYFYAESLFKIGKIRDAALKYNEFIESYPKSSRIPHALLRMGDCFRYLGDKATAKIYYEELINKHKNTNEASTAKKRLEQYFNVQKEESKKNKAKDEDKANKIKPSKKTSVVNNKTTKNTI